MSGSDPSLQGLRINKFISSSGYCSRREADSLIKALKVTINGHVASLGDIVNPEDEVIVDGNYLSAKPKAIYLKFHKPLGITCTTDRRDPSNIIDYINYPERIFPIGRLDKNSSGLILLTNDGDIVNKLLRATYGHEKEYEVRVSSIITNPQHFKAQMEGGIEILGQTTLPCKVVITGPHTFNITLKQGLNRQIRRMCMSLGYKVSKLRRIRFMNITLSGLKVGELKKLDSSELNELMSQIDI